MSGSAERTPLPAAEDTAPVDAPEVAVAPESGADHGATLVRTAAATRAGMVRANNQDAVFAGPVHGRPLLLVADGMGGHNTGEVASEQATEVVRRHLEASRAHPPAGLARAVQAANRTVLSLARADPRHHGMGTTLTAVLVDDAVALVAHVGDTRAYLLRDGRLVALTEDHSWVAERVRKGVLSEDEARAHRWRNVITNALGAMDRFRLDMVHLRLLPGDRLLIASDGVTSLLTPDALKETLARGDPEEAVAALLDAADARGSPDNVSAAVADVVRLRDEPKKYELPPEVTLSVEVGDRYTGIREVEAHFPGRGPLTWARKQPWYPYRLWILGSAYLVFLLVLFVAMR